MNENQSIVSKLVIPVSIIIAGALIATGIYFSGKSKAVAPTQANNQVQQALGKIEINPISDADHTIGNVKTAKLVIVDYSDTECPFCKQFHTTILQVMDKYKDKGVALVYRHFPLDIHPKSKKEAEATECANELGGQDVFWKYIDEVYAKTTSNNTLDPAKLYDFAGDVGLDKVAFKTCLDSGKYASKVDAQLQDALKAGGKGTPYTVFVFNGENIPLVDAQGNGLGALPFSAMDQIVGQFLNKK